MARAKSEPPAPPVPDTYFRSTRVRLDKLQDTVNAWAEEGYCFNVGWVFLDGEAPAAFGDAPNPWVHVTAWATEVEEVDEEEG